MIEAEAVEITSTQPQHSDTGLNTASQNGLKSDGADADDDTTGTGLFGTQGSSWASPNGSLLH